MEVVENVRRKEKESQAMVKELISESKEFSTSELQKTQDRVEVIDRQSYFGNGWALYQGDAVEEIKRIPDNTIDLSVYSPPFLALYQYSATERDMGNSKNEDEFFEHFGYLISDLLRVTKEGRLTCCHVSQVPAMLVRDGYIGLKDFRGRCVIEFEKRGWTYHGEIVIQKNPQVAAVRTHAKGLLFAQLKRDASWLRPAIADYVLVFRKPGENVVQILPDITNDQWISWAHPVWFDIRETDTLNALEARSDKDDRHICLAGGTLVLTSRSGYIPIEEVQIGDLVLTHKGRWMPVIGKRSNGIRKIVCIHAHGVADLRMTPDHQIWIRSCIGKGRWPGMNCGTSYHKFAAQKSDPEWLAAESVLGSYVNLKLPPIEDSPLTKEEWWIVGRWLGDGHRGGHHRSGRRGGVGQFFISCAHGEVPALTERLGQHVGHIATLTASQIALRDLRPEVRDVLSRCGNRAANKRLPGEAFALSPEKSEALLSGYLSADGHYNKTYDRWSASSISRSLLLGMSMVAQRARGVVASVYAGRPPRQGKILGRTVNMSQDWAFCFRNSIGHHQSGWIGIDGAWKKVRKISEVDQAEVWDLSVAEDESFTAEGAIVKNCPLQIGVIERCIRLWSNQGETVLDPFAGIGSTGYVAIQHKRRFLGIELKPLYAEVAAKNLKSVENEEQAEMFA
jgi:DNA modification methylase